jgi:hypothetical protein
MPDFHDLARLASAKLKEHPLAQFKSKVNPVDNLGQRIRILLYRGGAAERSPIQRFIGEMRVHQGLHGNTVRPYIAQGKS